VLHALMDALLSLAGLGDIGMLFPDTDPAFDGADSAKLLEVVMQRLKEAKIRLTHADVTVVAQKPKLATYKEAMRERLCALLELPASHVNVKATTEEKLGFTGALQGIKAYAVVSGMSAS
ncbi:MAG: 2-C-methyl-D-erythritol 2,4-cyclodiphosphate synthase, partial [Desulfovibrionaceae bacterium]|nr:2-C-methyl-D-erythritol 2,4-cyclodiphosphate synthase [Desulfovibrionaceae bacterium]